MSQRPGAIGRKAPLPHDYADLKDPANGDEAVRCEICGVPAVERDGEWRTAVEGDRFYRGMFVYLRAAFPEDRCEPCLRAKIARLPANVDPLTLDEVA